MAYLVKDAYARMTDEEISSFPKPDYSHINPLIVVLDAEKISWDQIHIDDLANCAKYQKGVDPAAVEEVKVSFAQGLKVQEPLPAVHLRDPKKTTPKPYVLRYGFHRVYALMALGTSGWFFNQIVKKKSKDSDEFIPLTCLLYTSPSPRDGLLSRMPSSA